MELNRKQIKSQARILVQNKWGALFVITFVVMVLTGMGMFNNSQINLVKQISHYNHASDYGSWDNREDNPLEEFDFDDQDEDDNPLEEFDGTGAITPVATSNNTAETMSVAALAGFGALFSLAALVLSPLNVTLDGYYVYFVRTAPPVRLGADLGQVFKNTFNKHYSGRLLLVILGGLFTFLWSLLLIIPGIVYSYGIYFANELMVDNPNLSPMEALKLSRRMVDGHRGELFRLDLSFILWWLLMACTAGIAGIYVLPYYKTTRALYYQNFRMRALATGQLTEDDFLSEAERMAKYGAYGAYTAPRREQQPMNGQYNPYTPPMADDFRSYEQCGYGGTQQGTTQAEQPQAPGASTADGQQPTQQPPVWNQTPPAEPPVWNQTPPAEPTDGTNE